MKPYGNIENITFYRALRFIDAYSFEEGIRNNTPINILYQPRGKKLPPDAPKTTLVWDSWELGVQNMPFMSQAITSNYYEKVDLNLLKLIHSGFYQIDDTIDLVENSANPGNLRDVLASKLPINTEAIWWSKEKSSNSSSRYIDAIENISSNLEFLKKAQLLPKQDFNYLQENNLIDPDSQPTARGTSDGYVWVMKSDSKNIYLTHSAYVGQHMQKWVEFFNAYTAIINSNYSMGFPAHYPLLTPLEFASFMQKWMVEVHPFSDGNGRNSRYWHDAIASAYQLPYAPAGWIQNDMIMTYSGYFKEVYQFTRKYLNKLENCVDLHKDKNLSKATKRDQYECALM